LGVRLAVARIWAAAAAAILAAAIADAATEFAANSGWIGAGLRDNDHQAVVPALLVGAAVALCLLVSVLCSRLSPRDPLSLRMAALGTRLADVACAFCGSVLCIVAMEGYETRFGGLSPFDPRSVVIAHAPALIVAFLLAGALVHYALRAAVRVAGRAGIAVAEFVEHFLERRLGSAAPLRAARISAFVLYVVHVPSWLARGSCGFRAPPRSIRPRCCLA
jgi:hypothetical protein